MLFPKPIAGKVARGEATLTIRPATSRPPAHGARRCVKVTQRGAISCHITIVDVREMLAGEVTFKQARACGYRTTDEFRLEWVRERDGKWIEKQEEWFPDGLGDAFVLDRFNARHASTPCYAITFTLAVDTPRFLAPSGRGTVMPVERKGDEGDNGKTVTDYVSSPGMAIDEVECVDEEWLARFAKTAEGFCIGRQAKRAREQAQEKADRGRSMRLAPHERFRRAA